MTTAATGLPFDDIRRLLDGPPLPDVEAADRLRADMPRGLGRLGDLAEWLAAWQGRAKPAIVQPLIAVFAANHRLADRGVVAGQMSDTQDKVEAVAAGGEAVSRVAMSANIGLKVFDLALDLPTPDIVEDDALDEAACAATMAFGMEAIAGGADLLCVGDMGTGNRVVAAALATALFGGEPETWLNDNEEPEFRNKQIDTVRAVAARLSGEGDPLEILRRAGGREFAAIAGVILAARYQKIPVLLDGPVSVAAAAILHAVNPAVLAHCRAAQVESDAGHAAMLDRIGMEPLLDLGLQGGHGLGAALAVDLCRTASAAASTSGLE